MIAEVKTAAEAAKCRTCGEEMRVGSRDYAYSMGGFPHVTIEAGQVRRCEKCKEEARVIPSAEDLHRKLAPLDRERRYRARYDLAERRWRVWATSGKWPRLHEVAEAGFYVCTGASLAAPFTVAWWWYAIAAAAWLIVAAWAVRR